MFFKFALLAVGVALASADPNPQHQFPAGVNPQLCPGYPHCDNAVLHGTAPAPAWGQPAPSWQQPAPSWQQPAPSWQQPAPAWGQPAPSWGAPAASAGGDKFPAGVNPSSCPNYPYCDVNAGGHGAPQVAPLPGWNERLYPAGVASHNCPNYPFCN